MLSIRWLCIFLLTGCFLAGNLYGGTLFKGRRIFLGNDKNSAFTMGVTGTTAGYNYIALIESAREETISLGKLGYWELVADPPSFLRNYDPQMIVKNRSTGKFQIKFEYDKNYQNINYKIISGAVNVKLDQSEYYPVLIISDLAYKAATSGTSVVQKVSRRYLFFDFNSFDSDLRQYYGSVKRMMKEPGFSHYFYYYESGNYNSYYFKTYKTISGLDTDKMGLSLEDGTLGYYQKVLDNLKARFGNDIADQVIIVSRFGKRFSRELKKYAHDIGIKKDMVITLWSYDDIE